MALDRTKMWFIVGTAFLLVAAALVFGGRTEPANAAEEVATVHGTVRAGNTSTPIAGIKVDAFTDPGGDLFVEGLTTDADGEWSFEVGSIDTGITLVVHFTDLGGIYDSQESSPVQPIMGQSSQVDVWLSSDTPGSISGVVTADSGGAPLPGIEVEASNWTGVASATTAADGSYSIDVQASDDFEVRFNDPSDVYGEQWFDGAVSPTEFVVVEAGVDTPNIDASLGAAGAITGRVTDASSGDPVEAVMVSARGQWYTSRVSMTLTNANGDYSVDGLGAGDYHLSFEGDRHETEWWDDVPANDAHLSGTVAVTGGATTSGTDAALTPSTGFIGRVYDDRSDAGIVTKVSSLSTAGGTDPFDIWDTASSVSGSYSLVRPAGEYELWAHDLYTSLFRSDALCVDPLPPLSIIEGQMLEIDFIKRAFCDVESGTWYFRSVESLASFGITQGYPDGSYRPDNTLTRGEMAVFLIAGLGETPTTPTENPFTDVDKGKWYAGYIDRLKELGLTTGYPDGTFRPSNTVTRGETAVFIVNALGVTPTAPTVPPFSDVPITAWFAPSVDHLKDVGYTSGYPDGTFRPHNTITRAEIAAFLQRAFLR